MPKKQKQEESKELSITPPQTIEKGNSAEALIARAIEKNVPVETMERLLAMRRELKAEHAKERFDKDMAQFQGQCPIIKKSKAGGKTKAGQVAYYYAPLDSILEQTKDLIRSYGFSYAIQTETGEGKVKVTCIVKHEAGHSESSEVEVPLGTKTEIMSAPQVVAAALTFAKRYAFCNAFGILTGDEDDDSQNVEEPKPVTQSKPAPAKPVTAKPFNPKEEIVKLLKKLGVDTQIKDKEKLLDNYKAVVLSLTGLELVESNYSEIINRLQIRSQETADAQKQ